MYFFLVSKNQPFSLRIPKNGWNSRNFSKLTRQRVFHPKLFYTWYNQVNRCVFWGFQKIRHFLQKLAKINHFRWFPDLWKFFKYILGFAPNSCAQPLGCTQVTRPDYYMLKISISSSNIRRLHIFSRQLDFSSEPGVANEILENEPKSCLGLAVFWRISQIWV